MEDLGNVESSLRKDGQTWCGAGRRVKKGFAELWRKVLVPERDRDGASRPSRGAWIETQNSADSWRPGSVAPLAGRVD